MTHSANDRYEEAKQIVLLNRHASPAHLQRVMSIGYNAATRMIERMEQEGLLSKPDPATGRRTIIESE